MRNKRSAGDTVRLRSLSLPMTVVYLKLQFGMVDLNGIPKSTCSFTC